MLPMFKILNISERISYKNKTRVSNNRSWKKERKSWLFADCINQQMEMPKVSFETYYNKKFSQVVGFINM